MAKWFCNDCKEHICNLCKKEANEKLRIARTHVITPCGTILEYNIENNLTITLNDAIVIMPAPSAPSAPSAPVQFLDITVSYDKTSISQNSWAKRKRDDDNDEAYEVVYVTRIKG